MNEYLYKIAHSINSLLNQEVRSAVDFLKYMEKLGKDDFFGLQNQMITEQVQYAYKNVPYYNKLFNENSISPSTIRTVSDLKLIPILTKDIVRSNKDKLISKQIHHFRTIKRRSGGTTGEPIEVLVDKRCQALETYSFLRGLEWMGYSPNLKMILLWGGSLGLKVDKSIKSSLRNFALNSLFIPAFDINSGTAIEYLSFIKKQGASCIRGYASAIYNLALYKLDLGFELNNVKLIITTSEQLEDEWRTTIKKAFECDVKSYYGCSEIESLGYQVYENGGYVIPNEINIIEQSNDDTSLIVTSLHNKSQPLIRYCNGDCGIVKESSIFDRRRPEILQLTGRSDDWLIGQDGERISGRLGAKLISVANIHVKKYQLIQFQRNQVEFRYDNFGNEMVEDEKFRLKTAIRNVLGSKVEITIIQSTDFILTRNNKFRITLCLCD